MNHISSSNTQPDKHKKIPRNTSKSEKLTPTPTPAPEDNLTPEFNLIEGTLHLESGNKLINRCILVNSFLILFTVFFLNSNIMFERILLQDNFQKGIYNNKTVYTKPLIVVPNDKHTLSLEYLVEESRDNYFIYVLRHNHKSRSDNNIDIITSNEQLQNLQCPVDKQSPTQHQIDKMKNISVQFLFNIPVQIKWRIFYFSIITIFIHVIFTYTKIPYPIFWKRNKTTLQNSPNQTLSVSTQRQLETVPKTYMISTILIILFVLLFCYGKPIL